MPSRVTSREGMWLVLLALLILSAGIGLRDPWPADEPRFALAAKEMVESGRWFFPTLNGHLYPDKPPVFMWLIAFFYALTGNMRFAFLLPSLLAGIGTLLLVYDLSRRLWSRDVAFLSGLALLLSYQFTLAARSARADATLCFWTTLGLYGLVRHLVLGPSWGWYFLAFVAMGLGVITKGVGFLPLLFLLPAVYARIKHWPGMPVFPGSPIRWLSGPLLLLGTLGLWLVPMLILAQLSGNPDFLAYRDNILFRQTLVRYSEPWHHLEPFWYTWWSALLYWFPLTVALPWILPEGWRRLRHRDIHTFLFLGWVFLVLLFFSFTAGKREIYILPALPAFILAASPLLPTLLERPRIHGMAFGVTVLLSGGLILLYFFYDPISARLEEILSKYEFDLRWLVLVMGLSGGAWAVWSRFKPQRGAVALLGFLATAWFLYGWWGYVLINPSRSAGPFMNRVADLIGPEAELGMVAWKEQFALHADRSVKTFGRESRNIEREIRPAAVWLLCQPNRWVLIPDDKMQPYFVMKGSIHVGWRHRKEWYLVRAQNISEDLASHLPDPKTWPCAH